MYAHSVRIELAQLILVGTIRTYQATGDAGILYIYIYIYVLYIFSIPFVIFARLFSPS